MAGAPHPLPPLEVVAAIIEDRGRILVARRRFGTAAGLWEFPGGKIEPNEDAAAALVREIAEELGVPIAVTDELGVDDTVVDGRVIRLRCLRARLTGGHPRGSSDHDRLEWVRPADLDGLDLAAPDLPMAARLSDGRSAQASPSTT